MANRHPTIEQNSHFSAKNSYGQDVEFTATLKFYVSPSGEVKISAPGATSQSESTSRTQTEIEMNTAEIEHNSNTSQGQYTQKSESVKTDTATTNINIKVEENRESVSKSNTEQDLEAAKESSIKVKHEGLRTDESIDRAFPRGPPDCPISQFIPDPCRAVDDIQKSLKNLFSGILNGRNCPPPQNTDALVSQDGRIVKQEPEVDISEAKGNKDESEIIQNEQKYEV